MTNMAAKLQNTWIFPNGLIGSVGCKNKKKTDDELINLACIFMTEADKSQIELTNLTLI